MLITSESVSEGHPDKCADQISDAILDAALTKDSHARVAIETLVKSGLCLIAGELSTDSWIDVENICRDVLVDIGYDKPELGFNGKTCAVLTVISKQSQDIAAGVDKSNTKQLGAGDQGLMFGYATTETETFMPAPISYSHQLMQQQAKMRKTGVLDWLGPDAKCQLSFAYENNKPKHIAAVVLSTQHHADVSQKTIKEAVMEHIIKPILPSKWLTKDTTYHINPTGRFVIGGPVGDCGLTGRKIIVDTYGGLAHHGGGCFSGKDPSKVDRSGAYLARYIAKNIVAAGLAERCEIQISYAIGVTDPTSLHVNSFGTGIIPDEKIAQHIQHVFDLTPYGIIQQLNLLRPIYQKTACYGHFGRNEPEFTWEMTDKIANILDAANLRNPVT